MALSPKQAIKAKCKECIYDPHGNGGTWIQQTESCTSYSCPLFELRPVTLKTKQLRDEKYLAGLSDEERIIVQLRREEVGKRLLNSTKLTNIA